MMKVFAALLMTLGLPTLATAQSPSEPGADWLAPYRAPIARLVGAAFADTAAWDRLARLTDRFGPRLSGSPALDAAIGWASEQMRADGFDEVRLEPVRVPRWVRGSESLSIVKPLSRPLPVLGLGGSVATPPEGIEAETLVVSSFAELDVRAADARGRIVLFNPPFTNYGETVQYRSQGASRAAQVGAVAALLRSVGPVGLRTVHTGALNYSDSQPKIPAAAIAAEDADALARLQADGIRPIVRLHMEARAEPDVDSANVVAELRGRELPDEFVVLGCHIDSWDVGTGASDDAAGCIVAWEAARLIKALELRPRRTIRVVLFTNEENGLRGGLAYRDRHRDSLSRHVLMIESDSGVFPPIGLGVSGPDGARARLRDLAPLLEGIEAGRVDPYGGGADIGPSAQAGGIPAASINGDSARYFLVHHTAADMVDRIDPRDVSRAVAAMAALGYLAAEIPERFGDPR